MIEQKIDQLNQNLEIIIGLLQAQAGNVSTSASGPTAPAPTAPPAAPAAPSMAPAASTASAPAGPATTAPAAAASLSDQMTLQDAQTALNKEMQRLGKPDQIIALLSQFGVQRLSDITDPSQYGQLVAAAQQLQPEA